MKKEKCLYCYQTLENNEPDFHPECSRTFFGTLKPPSLDYSNTEMKELAREAVLKSVAVTGVQPKISLTLEKNAGDPKNSRLTIVGLWGNYILKPPSEQFDALPENEDVTMHLASILKISTADHSLIRLKSGELAYITKRFDRMNGKKLAQEDLCQLTETLTENKYRGSLERVGKKIAEFSDQPGLDMLNYFELNLFSFLTGNADMHLKNFSLLTNKENRTALSPAYDLVSTRVALPEDQEESALTINGKKNRLTKADFDALAKNLKLDNRAVSNLYSKFETTLPALFACLERSFLRSELIATYKSLIAENSKKLGLSSPKIKARR